MKKFFKDFKAFVSRGNILDLAIAVVIGGAFGKIVTSLVNDIIMPLLGLLFGRVDLKNLKTVIKAATETTAAVTINWGIFIQSIIDFLLIALTIFVVLRILMKSKENFEKLANKVLPPDNEVKTEPVVAEPIVTEAAPEAAENVVSEDKRKNADIAGLLTEIRDLLKKEE